MRILCLLLLSVLLASCAWFAGDGGPNYGPTLANLEPAKIPEAQEMPVPQIALDEIEESYRAALEVAKDPEVRQKILVRLADIEMANSENRQIEATEQGEYFDDAITMYEELVDMSEQGMLVEADNERLLYQLSKAYALDGRLEESNRILSELVSNYPDSKFSAEAEFRRAEQAFNAGDYALAENLYGKVMAVGRDTPFYANAVYMHGWSQFKRNRYRAAVDSFTEVLDGLLIEGQSVDELSNTEKNLVADTLRVMSITFSYLDGAQTITDVYSNIGVRHYQYLLYMNLGDLYLEKERFRDSAETYRHYVKHFPNTDQAPSFSVKAIETYKLGDFPSLILPAKEEYVNTYGVYSEFWDSRTEEERKPQYPYLHQYLDEISSYYHADAQTLKAMNAEYEQLAASGKRPKEKPDSALPQYLEAAAYYKQFIATFPQDKKTPEMAFLMGEAYFEAGNLPDAVDAYETVAYNYLDQGKGPEAGYAAIVTLQMLVDRVVQSERDHWQTRKINSAISFADYYPQDKRAPAVLTKAAQELFEQGDTARATTIAKRMTEWQPAPEKSLQKTAWLILAHSQFESDDYANAEFSYRKTLGLIEPNDPDRPQIVERIAASIYRSSEMQVAGGDVAGAVEKLLSLKDVAPGSDIAVSGQYDAANHLMELKDWSRAEAVLLDFRRNYPEHELTPTIAPKLAVIYQESEQWAKAAGVLEEMAANNSDPEVRRQSQYLSAELYEKTGRTNEAIEQYKNYANNYPQPFDLATEARYHLVELYGQVGDSGKRNYWLQKLIDEDKAAGSRRTERSKYLAAFAATKFANDEFERYRAVKLTLPLKNSLKKKKAAMDKTLASYKMVLDYGIAEFATEANNRVGMLYGQLSRDLMDSERPKGLDDLALEQYEILLEEQAYPFEEKAIDIHTANAKRAWDGIYDDWVKRSFAALAELLPARYGKQERKLEVSNGIY